MKLIVSPINLSAVVENVVGKVLPNPPPIEPEIWSCCLSYASRTEINLYLYFLAVKQNYSNITLQSLGYMVKL